MTDYFHSPAVYWYFIILPALGINFMAFYSPNILNAYVPVVGPFAAHVGFNYHWITVVTNLFALIAHISESIFALYLCTKLDFSLPCSARWFLQTLFLGFPSLTILRKFANKRRIR